MLYDAKDKGIPSRGIMMGEPGRKEPKARTANNSLKAK